MGGKPNIAFVTGGLSAEAEVSYQSALTIEQHLDREKYDIYTIDIRPEGWIYTYDFGKVHVDRDDFSLLVSGRKIWFDAVLIGIHGTPGEDGKLQGYLDLHGIPYTTCDAATSAITFNKRYTVAVAAFSGIDTARSVLLHAGQSWTADEVLRQLSLPLFVKPNNGGSSIGMSRVDEEAALEEAIHRAFREDVQVLVEEFIPGREFTVGVVRTLEGVRVLPITEIRPHNKFFDYAAKYKAESDELTPAPIPEETAELLRSTARKAFDLFNCRGVVRMDFILHAVNGRPYLLEINTVPGQSAASLVPQQLREMGWPLRDFYSALIDEALSRRRR